MRRKETPWRPISSECTLANQRNVKIFWSDVENHFCHTLHLLLKQYSLRNNQEKCGTEQQLEENSFFFFLFFFWLLLCTACRNYISEKYPPHLQLREKGTDLFVNQTSASIRLAFLLVWFYFVLFFLIKSSEDFRLRCRAQTRKHSH